MASFFARRLHAFTFPRCSLCYCLIASLPHCLIASLPGRYSSGHARNRSADAVRSQAAKSAYAYARLNHGDQPRSVVGETHPAETQGRAPGPPRVQARACSNGLTVENNNRGQP
ncbi:hypothetical protein GGF40_000404 [Coemansia sp. RSA 1286]|nr:hypothetical protein GGF40_000404 [Coemansia sp. RSA 1286]